MQKKPTLKTLAEETGLALTTISRALANDEKIARSTRQMVAEVAERIGYVPDRAAQRLRTGRTNVIALVVSPHEEILGFRGSMIAGLTTALRGTRYHLSMTPYDWDEDPLVPIRHIVQNRLADGLVFSGTSPQDPRVAYLDAQDFPFVTHGRTSGMPAHAWCDYDNDAFAAIAVRRLVERGRRRLFIIPPSPARTYHHHMMKGFERAGRKSGAVVLQDPAITLSTPILEIQKAIPPLLRDHQIDGFICPGEVSAMSVLAALQDGGIAVGDKVDVLAKQTSQTFDLYRPKIDTIYEDIRQAGNELGKLLLRRIAGEEPGKLTALLKPEPNFRTG